VFQTKTLSLVIITNKEFDFVRFFRRYPVYSYSIIYLRDGTVYIPFNLFDEKFTILKEEICDLTKTTEKCSPKDFDVASYRELFNNSGTLLKETAEDLNELFDEWLYYARSKCSKCKDFGVCQIEVLNTEGDLKSLTVKICEQDGVIVFHYSSRAIIAGAGIGQTHVVETLKSINSEEELFTHPLYSKTRSYERISK
jgi:hypothetical protein